MHATCFIILTAKQENSHTEGVWHHHLLFIRSKKLSGDIFTRTRALL
jgi:hypothetical protein